MCPCSTCHRIFKLFVAVLFLGTVGCATIMNGSTQKVGITSTPSGSKVYVDGKEMGVTPAFLEMDRETQHVISLEKPGYERQDVAVTPEVSGWVWGNILLGGVIGLGVDYATGSLYRLEPAQVGAQMEKAHPVAQVSP